MRWRRRADPVARGADLVAVQVMRTGSGNGRSAAACRIASLSPRLPRRASAAALRWRGLSGAARRHPVLPAVHGPSFPAAAFCRCDSGDSEFARIAYDVMRNRTLSAHATSMSTETAIRVAIFRARTPPCDARRAPTHARRARDHAARRKRPPDFTGGRPTSASAARRRHDGNGRLNAPAARASPNSAWRQWQRRDLACRQGRPALNQRAAKRRPRPNQRAAKGGTGRCSGPSYQDSGRISRLSAPCSKTCAAQPVMRAATKIGVNSGISKPIR